ncbi:MAG TPA: hypothetical protein VJB87_03660 [Candidatus Nanoarchaeia archaeon]|nr:hypothetical protein [Candidatus Nanoarchaeia archaeon]
MSTQVPEVSLASFGIHNYAELVAYFGFLPKAKSLVLNDLLAMQSSGSAERCELGMDEETFRSVQLEIFQGDYLAYVEDHKVGSLLCEKQSCHKSILLPIDLRHQYGHFFHAYCLGVSINQVISGTDHEERAAVGRNIFSGRIGHSARDALELIMRIERVCRPGPNINGPLTLEDLKYVKDRSADSPQGRRLVLEDFYFGESRDDKPIPF